MGSKMGKTMRRPISVVALVAGGLVLALGVSVAATTTGAAAGPIERACMGSDRKAANPALCGCIQRVADMTLKDGDQRRAAKFFRDPDAAQEVRMSERSADDAFWDRYRNFGEAASAYCAG
jgi:hypothetical protein